MALLSRCHCTTTGVILKFTAVLLVFILERLGRNFPRLQSDRWFFRLGDTTHRAITRTGLPPWLAPMVQIGLPCAVIAYTGHVLDDTLFGLPGLLLAMLVLVYSLGRGDFDAQINLYHAHWRAGRAQSAYHIASRFRRSDAVLESGDLAQLHRHVVEALLYQGFERWFCVVFWFVAAGPWAALAYRLGCLYTERRNSAPDPAAVALDGFIALLEWLPVRLLGLSFAIAGNFASCFRVWRQQMTRSGFSSPTMLRLCGVAALGEDEAFSSQQSTSVAQAELAVTRASKQILELYALLRRSAVVWLVAMAVFLLVFD
jgi:AmpE protein